jgi:hypothetical protein
MSIVAVATQQVLHILSTVLVIHHAKRMRRILLSPATSLALPHFSTLSYKGIDFRGGGELFEHKMRVLIFSTTCVRNVSHSKNQNEESIINRHRSSCKVAVILVRFQ